MEYEHEIVYAWENLLTQDSIIQFVNDNLDIEVLAYDIETQGLYGRVLCLGMYGRKANGEEVGACVPMRYDSHSQTDFSVFQPLFDNAKTVAHFGKFDDVRLIPLGLDPKLSFDTGLAHMLLDENSSQALGNLAPRYLEVPPWKETVDRSNLEAESWDNLSRYCMQDVVYTLYLYDVFKQKLWEDERLVRLFKFSIMPANTVLTHMELRGLGLDVEAAQAMREEYTRQSDTLRTEMKALLPDAYKGINWNSTQQLGRFMFSEDGLGLYPLFYTDKGNPSVDKRTLSAFQEDHEVLRKLLEYRKLNKVIGTYLSPWLDCVRGGRIHGEFKMFGTVTGRLSSANPNLQNIPKKLHDLIVPSPGKQFCTADYSQIELRIAAVLSGDPTMKEAYRTGQDLHLITASSVLGKPVEEITPDERQLAKAVNFGLLYGMRAEGFQSYAKDMFGVELSMAEAIEYRLKFFETYPALEQWHRKRVFLAHRLGYVRSPLGRIRRLPDLRSEDQYARQRAERQAINAPVQAVPPELTFMAMAELEQIEGIDLVGQVHDEILMEIPLTDTDHYVTMIKKVMENPPLKRYLGVELSVPIVVDVKVGPSWGRVVSV